MTRPTHTPTPRVARVYVENSPDQFHVVTGRWGEPSLAACADEATAEKMLGLIRSHAALVEALRDAFVMDEDREKGFPDDDLHITPREWRKKARAALALVGEE